jgi:type IV pilus assembly protein PilM
MSALKKQGFFARAFPVPEFLATPLVGIEIAHDAVTHMSLKRGKRGFTLRACGKESLPEGALENGMVRDASVLTKVLASVRAQNGYTRVHLGLPEEQASLFHTEVPLGSFDDMAQMVESRLKENLPLSPEDASFDFDVVHTQGETASVVVSAYPREVVQDFISACEEAGLEPVSCVPIGLADAHALVSPHETRTVAIIHLGMSASHFSVVADGAVVLTVKLETSAELFFNAFPSKEEDRDETRALVRRCGAQNKAGCEEVYSALAPFLKNFAEEVHTQTSYWHMHVQGSTLLKDISFVWLVGTGAGVAGVAEFLEHELGLSVRYAQVWQKDMWAPMKKPPCSLRDSLAYVSALGLAFHGISLS